MSRENFEMILNEIPLEEIKKDLEEGIKILKKCKKNKKCKTCNEYHKLSVDEYIKKIKKNYTTFDIYYCIDNNLIYNINDINCKEIKVKIDLLKKIYKLKKYNQ